jgi:hypothetical protein
MRTIARLFDNREDAMQAVGELERAGISHHDLSMVASHKDAWFKSDKSKDSKLDDLDDRGEGMRSGATTGGILGGGAGLLAGLGLLAIPGLGPVVAAGWLASLATGAVAGAAAGGVVGGIVGALTKSGVPPADAHVYAEGIRRGGTLLTVRVADDRVSEVEAILNRFTTIDVRQREKEYRDSGWRGLEGS